MKLFFPFGKYIGVVACLAGRSMYFIVRGKAKLKKNNLKQRYDHQEKKKNSQQEKDDQEQCEKIKIKRPRGNHKVRKEAKSNKKIEKRIKVIFLSLKWT